MQPQQVEQLLAAMLLGFLLEGKRILENAASNHNTVYPILLCKLEAGLTVGNIAVDGQ
ncbi:hypothetical protein D3C78_1816630 [compost metagenome]